ncbi:MAG: type II/IV secretion system protein, partial [Pseudomonadales bacterium]|nr:type II/IV secretion system protein [Pseudomonadales bacterium]
SEGHLQQALAEQKSSGKKLGRVLVDLQLVREDDLLQLLAQQLKIPFIDLDTYPYKLEFSKQLPEALARRFRSILLSEQDGRYLIGMSDPLDIHALDELQRRLNRIVSTAVVREHQLLSAIDSLYSKQDEIASLAGELEDELRESDIDIATLASGATAADAPVARLLQSLFEDAVRLGASDIHIEPDESVMRIRKRIDGILHEQVMNERRIAAAVVLKLKILSDLDISEKRLPQDGRFGIKVLGKNIDVRLSTLPTSYGESVVLRLLDHSSSILSLDNVGMPASLLQRFRAAIQRPHGMILVTGPTGSGKTTTLYGALGEINQPDIKIITVEDPIEYQLPRVVQVQVNAKIELTFDRVLRSALRQDPDVVMIGEMRDYETAQIGLRAAITGHLVFSTLHTNDSISAAMRFIDMGVEPYMVASALRAILAQRLVRRLCVHCKTVDDNPDEYLDLLIRVTGAERPVTTFYKAQGCRQCNMAGYKGRIGVHEWLEFTEAMTHALREADQNAFVAAARASPNYHPLALTALELAAKGLTSLAEVTRLVEAAD